MPLGSLLGQLRHCAVRAVSPASCHLHTSSWRADSSRISLTRLLHQAYARLYPVLLVKQEGSTIHIRYREPRCMLSIALDLDALSPEEHRAGFCRRLSSYSKRRKSRDN